MPALKNTGFFASHLKHFRLETLENPLHSDEDVHQKLMYR